MMRWEKLHKIAVCGSRKFSFLDSVTVYLDKYIRKNFENTEDVVIITGGALGVDNTVERYCQRRGIKNLIVYARWTELDRVAGPRRNRHIVDMADEMFAFWDKESPGTRDAIRKAKKKGIPLKIVYQRQIAKLIKPEITVVKLPSSATKRDAKNIRKLIKEARPKEFFKVKNKKEIRKYFLEK